MSSIAQLVSEIAHSVQQADSVPVRRAIKLSIIHSRNELIRKSYDNNKTVDKVLQQRFRLTLIDVPDGDLAGTQNLPLVNIKRTLNKVPRATRLDNNLPFLSVRTAGLRRPISIPFVKEASSGFYNSLPGMGNIISYDLINDYVYVDTTKNQAMSDLGSIIIESPFEQPHLIRTETSDGILNIEDVSDEDEFLIPEDMINSIKKMVLETFNPQVNRQTNEIPTSNLVK